MSINHIGAKISIRSTPPTVLILSQPTVSTCSLGQSSQKLLIGDLKCHIPFLLLLVVSILVLLCATAQQSYCHHAGVRRPSSLVRKTQTLSSELTLNFEKKNKLRLLYPENRKYTE